MRGIFHGFALESNALYSFALNCFCMNCIVLYCIVLYCIVLYCIVLCCIVLYEFISHTIVHIFNFSFSTGLLELTMVLPCLPWVYGFIAQLLGASTIASQRSWVRLPLRPEALFRQTFAT